MKKYSKLLIQEEAHRCLLCYDAPCSKVCPAKSNPSEFIRSLRFENMSGALNNLRAQNPLAATCSDLCDGSEFCEKVCIRNKIGSPVQIQTIHKYLSEQNLLPMEKVSNSTKIACYGDNLSSILLGIYLFSYGYDVYIFADTNLLGTLGSEKITKDLDCLKKEGLTVLNTSDFSKYAKNADCYISSHDMELASSRITPPTLSDDANFVQKMSVVRTEAKKIIKNMEVK